MHNPANGPSDDEIMAVMALTNANTEQFCNRLRDLFQEKPLPPRSSLQSLEEMETEVHQVNVANGWFNGDRSPVEGDMLMVTEVAEATEAYRAWGMEDMTGMVSLEKSLLDPDTGEMVHKPEGVASEYADQFIRVLDECTRAGVNLRQEYERKIRYNRLRGYRHGNKKL